MLVVVVLLMLALLLLLEGTCAITLLPTNKAGNRGVGKSETKWGYNVSWSKSSFKALIFFLSISLFLFFSFARAKTQEEL